MLLGLRLRESMCRGSWGFVSGALFIVPYLGVFLGVFLGTVLALLKFGDFVHVLGVWAVFAGSHAVEAFFLTPRVLGDRVGLHPLSVIVAILVGGELFGFVGVLLAVPATAVLKVALAEAVSVYRCSGLYVQSGTRTPDE